MVGVTGLHKLSKISIFEKDKPYRPPEFSKASTVLLSTKVSTVLLSIRLMLALFLGHFSIIKAKNHESLILTIIMISTEYHDKLWL